MECRILGKMLFIIWLNCYSILSFMRCPWIVTDDCCIGYMPQFHHEKVHGYFCQQTLLSLHTWTLTLSNIYWNYIILPLICSAYVYTNEKCNAKHTKFRYKCRCKNINNSFIIPMDKAHGHFQNIWWMPYVTYIRGKGGAMLKWGLTI